MYRIPPMKYGAAFTRFVIAQKTQFYCVVTEGMGVLDVQWTSV
ncbi:MAG: hypothetical protein Q4F83_11740 [Eubacteriales bacterium]|nr:hypothetical protein [Eubacteriales bacterium]